jgi:hypothetical protein
MKRFLIIGLAIAFQLTLFVFNCSATEVPATTPAKKAKMNKKVKKKEEVASEVATPTEKKVEEPVKEPVKEPEKPMVVVPSYLSSAFDPSINMLPPAFLGHNVKEIHKAFTIRKASSVKGEFESTALYNKRLMDEASAPLIGTIKANDLLAFRSGYVKSKYDADSQILTINIGIAGHGDLNKREIILTGVGNEETVTAYNGFGAPVKITKSYKVFHVLKPNNISKFNIKKIDIYADWNTYYWDLSIEHKINIAPDDAKVLKENIGFLVLVKAVPPYVTDLESQSEATYKSPYSEYRHTFSFDVEIQEFWIYDKTTGKILAKIKPING